ncbi:MAG: hypothetical protein ABFD79_08330 [Phycisphaerales bacterium]
MSILLDFLMILFLIFVTISIIGLLWSFIKEKPLRKWTIRLTITLLLFITTATLQNNYLLSQERKENTARYQEQRQAAAIQNEKSNALQSLVTQQLNQLEQNILADKLNQQQIKATEASIKTDIAVLNAKLDYLIKYITSFSK